MWSKFACIYMPVPIITPYFTFPHSSSLARSAQFWSSYSGYLREVRTSVLPFYHAYIFELHLSVAQLCQVFRRWNDIGALRYFFGVLVVILLLDLARDIYRNATMEKIALIRFILDREKKSAQYDERLNQRIPVRFYAQCNFHQSLSSPRRYNN